MDTSDIPASLTSQHSQNKSLLSPTKPSSSQIYPQYSRQIDPQEHQRWKSYLADIQPKADCDLFTNINPARSEELKQRKPFHFCRPLHKPTAEIVDIENTSAMRLLYHHLRNDTAEQLEIFVESGDSSFLTDSDEHEEQRRGRKRILEEMSEDSEDAEEVEHPQDEEEEEEEENDIEDIDS